MRAANHCRQEWKAFHMSDKVFSSAQGAPNQDKPSDKSKAAPATAKPVAQPEKTPTKVAPARKS